MLQFGLCGGCGGHVIIGFLVTRLDVSKIQLRRSRCCRGVGLCIGYICTLVCFMNGFGIPSVNCVGFPCIWRVFWCHLGPFSGGCCAGFCWFRAAVMVLWQFSCWLPSRGSVVAAVWLFSAAVSWVAAAVLRLCAAFFGVLLC